MSVAAATWVLTLMIPVLGCTSDEGHAGGEGVSRVSLPLISMNAAGDTFVLENVQVEIRQGMTLVTSLVGNDMDLMETVLSADLAAGTYTAELAAGWRLMQLQDDGSRVQITATLRGSPVRDFTVQDDATTTLTYVFETNGGQVGFGGSVEIGFEVETADGDVGPVIPEYDGICPVLATGTVNVLRQNVQRWVGAEQVEPGPLVFYWHGTGSTSGEAQFMLGSAFADVLARGGMIASFTTTTGSGANTTGTGTWFEGDFEMADILLACAVQQLNIDTHRIYTAGCSAGGLQAGAMTYDRSSYLAGAMPNSGGLVFPRMPQDAHVPSVITAHGGASDVVVLSFAETSATLYNGIAARSGFAVNCDHGGGHCGSPPELRQAQWQFLLDHPFGVSPDPYPMGLPPSFPSYCATISP